MSGSQSSRPLSSRPQPAAKSEIRTDRPASADWTRGHEVHMEGREPFEVWRSGLHSQIANLERNMKQLDHQCRDDDSVSSDEGTGSDFEEAKALNGSTEIRQESPLPSSGGKRVSWHGSADQAKQTEQIAKQTQHSSA